MLVDSTIKKQLRFLALITVFFSVNVAFSYANLHTIKNSPQPTVIINNLGEKEKKVEITKKSAIKKKVDKKLNKSHKSKSPDNDFYVCASEYAKKLEVPTNWFLAMLAHESNFNSKAKNPYSSAAGILQFTAGTAKMLGTSKAAILRMSAIEQLPYAYKYYAIGKEKYGRFKSPTAMYIYALLPSMVVHSEKPYFVLMQKGDKYYGINSGLDTDNNGKVQVYEITNRIKKFL